MRRRIRPPSERVYRSNHPRIEDLSLPVTIESASAQALLAVLEAVEGQGRFLRSLCISVQEAENDCLAVHIQRYRNAEDTFKVFPAEYTVCSGQIVQPSETRLWCSPTLYTEGNAAKDRALGRATIAGCSVLWGRYPARLLPFPAKWALLTTRRADQGYLILAGPNGHFAFGMTWVMNVSPEFQVEAAVFSNR